MDLRDVGSRAGATDYASLGVPWWDGSSVHWQGQSIEQDDVSSLTATSDAAIFLHDRTTGRAGDEEPEMGRGTLSVLFADGPAEQLASDVVGVPLADPSAHVVAWAALVGHDKVVVTAYDTATRAVLGTSGRLDALGGGVDAVVGNAVYFTDEDKSFAWRPRLGRAPRPAARTVVGGGDYGLLVMGPRWKMHVVAADGTRKRVPTFIGSVSPNGRYVAAIDPRNQNLTAVGSLRTGKFLDLRLPAHAAVYRIRWTPAGRAVVAAVDGPRAVSGSDATGRVSNYVCAVHAGDCRPIDGGPEAVWQVPELEASFLGVLATLFEAIGS